MRLALLSSTTDGLIVRIGLMPFAEKPLFPVTAVFDKNKLKSFGHGVVYESKALGETADVLGYLDKMITQGDFEIGCTADEFATAIEKRFGRQVVEVAPNKYVSIGKIKENDDAAKNVWYPMIGEKFIETVNTTAEDEKEAVRNLRHTFVTAASKDKKLAKQLSEWLIDGSKVYCGSAIEKFTAKNVINLHDYK